MCTFSVEYLCVDARQYQAGKRRFGKVSILYLASLRRYIVWRWHALALE